MLGHGAGGWNGPRDRLVNAFKTSPTGGYLWFVSAIWSVNGGLAGTYQGQYWDGNISFIELSF